MTGGAAASRTWKATLLGLVRDSGRRSPPEDSVALRASAAGAVCVAIAACKVEGELPTWFAAMGAALVVVGSAVSYQRRASPLPYLKALLAATMVGAFGWFLLSVISHASGGYLGPVEAPLAALFTFMQAAHAFDMPSRRDLGFALAGSGSLLAVAAAQAVSLSFGLFVVAWGACCVVGMAAAWSSMAGGARVRATGVLGAVIAALVVAVLLIAFLPTPLPPSPSAAAFQEGGGAFGSEPSHLVPAKSGHHEQRAASPSGPTGVGGYLGFAGRLDTALRPSFGNQVVLRVRADRPTYWVAETYDTWSGRSWTQTRHGESGAGEANGARARHQGSHSPGAPRRSRGPWETVTGGSPFIVAPEAFRGAFTGGEGLGPSDASAARPPSSSDYQTFYLVSGSSDLVLHADRATALWLPARRVYIAPDDTIRSAKAFGAGSVYSVLSTVATPSQSQLAQVRGRGGLTSARLAGYLELPHPYPRAEALAHRVTAGRHTIEAKVVALEHWIGNHTTYTTDIPPLGPHQNTVDQFLFGSRRGFCEQISTSLAVMLRSLGIPAREAVGYVPGPFNPVTGLYDEQAKDAHAWVQVWFPGFGWQSFDPTAYVPVAPPSSGSTLAGDLAATASSLGRLPIGPTAAGAGALLMLALFAVWTRRRPRSWREAVTRDLERAARRAGVADDRSATLTSLATSLDGALERASRAVLPSAAALAAEAERAAWLGHDPVIGVQRERIRAARRVRRAARGARPR